MIAAYAIRKLFEAKKLSDRLSVAEINVHRFALRGPAPHFFNVHRFWKNYDLDNTECAQLSLRELCNQIIHSFTWTPVVEEDGHSLAGIMVSSRERRKHLYAVDIDEIVTALRDVGYDDVVAVQWRVGENGEDHMRLLGADVRTAHYEWLMTGHRPQDWIRESQGGHEGGQYVSP